MDRIRSQGTISARPLLSPLALRESLPLLPEQELVVERSRDAISAILDRADDRLLLVVGPCSVHDPAATLEYAERLREVADRFQDDLLIVMRVYFEKPRTTVGWKGLIADPGLDESFRVADGLRIARALLLQILSLGLPVGCEFLDPISPLYIEDAVSWGAIGARTSQSQVHRQVASGLPMPVGFKNLTEGDIQGAIDGVTVAAHRHVFAGIAADGTAAVTTTSGNPDAHIVLRGGKTGPNYDHASVTTALELLEKSGQRRRVVIDASHDNSGKDHRRQSLVVNDVANRVASGEREVVGLMLESFLIEGRQDLFFGKSAELVYGQSITDACIGWNETAGALELLAGAVQRRNAGA